MSVTSGGTAPNPCRSGGSWSLGVGSVGIVAVFSMRNLAPSPPPGLDRAFQVCGVDHDAEEAVLSDGIMRRPHLERHLVVGAEVDRLHAGPSPEIPEVDPMAVLSAALR
jgi:hypothetical protein